MPLGIEERKKNLSTSVRRLAGGASTTDLKKGEGPKREKREKRIGTAKSEPPGLPRKGVNACARNGGEETVHEGGSPTKNSKRKIHLRNRKHKT